jgi:hypothetical protein
VLSPKSSIARREIAEVLRRRPRRSRHTKSGWMRA